MIGVYLTLFYLVIQAFLDQKTGFVNNYVSWAMIFLSIPIVALNILATSNLFIGIEYLIGLITVFLLFFFIKKHFTKEFGGGDFWGVLTIQALNPTQPFILMSLVVYSFAAILGFLYSKKTKREDIRFFPFLLVSYLLVAGYFGLL